VSVHLLIVPEVCRRLAAIPLFSRLPASTLKAIAFTAKIQDRGAPPPATLFRAADASYDLFVLSGGTARVGVPPPDRPPVAAV